MLLTLLMTFGTLPLDVVLADEEPEHQEQVQQADQADVPAAAEEELAGESSQPEQETAPPAPETTAEPSQGNVGEPPVTEAPTSESEKVVALTYEDEDLVACVEAPESVLRGCVGLVVEEVVPVDEESADAYAEALTGLSEMLREEGRSYTSATVYDIRLLDANGDEIEPAGQVDVTLSFKRALPLAEDEAIAQADAQNAATPDDVDVAHLDDEGNATAMGADMTTNNDGELEEAAFATDSFSYYIVFGSNAGSESEPANIGDYGWIRFQTPDSHDSWGTYNPPRVPLPALGSNDAFRRIMQVRLWNVKPGGDESSHDPDNYDLVTDTMYYWTWENQIYIEAASSVSWNIGVTPDASTPFYPTSDFSYQQVSDTTGAYKGVDRTQGANAKPYLNAQIGEAVITNVPGEIVYALPSAGGPGAYPFLLVGAFVATHALSGVWDGKRRNRAGQRKRGIS